MKSLVFILWNLITKKNVEAKKIIFFTEKLFGFIDEEMVETRFNVKQRMSEWYSTKNLDF